MSASNNQGNAQWLDRLLRWALLLCCGMALSKALADPDFWGHVQYARDAFQDGLPEQSSYTYTAVGHRWINHENLAEIAFAVGVDYLGPSALLLFKCLAGMGALALILRQADRRGVGQVAAYTGAMLVAANMMLFWTLRPQLFSFLFFVAMLVVLEHAFTDWNPVEPRTRQRGLRLLWLVPLLAFWTNTHGGFLAGFAVLSAYLFLRGVESWVAIARHASRNSNASLGNAAVGPKVLELAGVLGGVVALCGLATLLNPYGWQLHAWLLQSLGEARPEIIEWRPPEFTLPWIPFWCLAVAIMASTIGSNRKRDWVQIAVIGLTLWQSMEHRRHVVFLSLLFGFWMLPHFDALLKRLKIGCDDRTIGESLEGGARWGFAMGLSAAMLLLLASLFTQVRRIPVRHDSYPVDAFQFIEDHQLQGRLLIQLRWGQYAIAAFGNRAEGSPGARLDVAFDGRFRTCYPQRVVDRYFDFAEGVDSPYRNRSKFSPPADEQSILNDDPQPDFVLIERAWPNPVRVMHSRQDDWVLLYQDPLCQLYGRRDQCDVPESDNYVPLAAREVRALPLTEVTPWPALPRPAADGSQEKLAKSTGLPAERPHSQRPEPARHAMGVDG